MTESTPASPSRPIRKKLLAGLNTGAGDGPQALVSPIATATPPIGLSPVGSIGSRPRKMGGSYSYFDTDPSVSRARTPSRRKLARHPHLPFTPPPGPH